MCECMCVCASYCFEVRGVSLEERYYGRFMHRLRVPEHRLSTLIIGGLIIATVVNYYLR